jgi:hypothetical protein
MSLIRYKSNDNPLLMTEKELLELMMERAGSKRWANVQYIQNYIVTSNSMAERLICKYIAPIDFANPSAEIKYSLERFESDEKLKMNDVYRYAQKVCTIIAQYLAQMHKIVRTR